MGESVQKCVQAYPEDWKEVHLSLLGPFPITEKGNKFVIYLYDNHSQWVEAKGIQEANAETLAPFLIETFFQVGWPEKIFSDLQMDLLESINAQIKIYIREIEKYNFGLPEKQMLKLKSNVDATYKEIMRPSFVIKQDADESSLRDEEVVIKDFTRILNAISKNWDMHMYFILFYLRCKNWKHQSPFVVMYGREPCYVVNKLPEEILPTQSREENKNVPSPSKPKVRKSARIAKHKVSKQLAESEKENCGRTDDEEISLESNSNEDFNADYGGDELSNASVECTADNDATESSDLTNHPKEKKKGKRVELLPHKCPKCPATYLASEQALQLHLQCHTDSGKIKFKCPFCNWQSQIWCRLQNHMISQHKNEVGSITIVPESNRKCPHCEKMFEKRDALKKHINLKHSEKFPMKCKICLEGFVGKYQLRRHQDLVHNKVLHNCKDCAYKTQITRNFKLHRRIHEGRGHQCHVCSKIFYRQNVLNAHLKIHSSERPKLVCDQCGAELASLDGLNKHIRIFHDNGGDTFVCSQCPYTCKLKERLARHVASKHSKQIVCPYCEYKCHNELALDRHISLVHDAERQFPCKQCTYRALTNKQLNEHIRYVHNPDALKFKCSYCSKMYRNMTQLRHHQPVHTGQHLYNCLLCGHSVKFRPTMLYHVKRKHPGFLPRDVYKVVGFNEIIGGDRELATDNTNGKGTVRRNQKKGKTTEVIEIPESERDLLSPEELDDNPISFKSENLEENYEIVTLHPESSLMDVALNVETETCEVFLAEDSQSDQMANTTNVLAQILPATAINEQNEVVQMLFLSIGSQEEIV